MMDKMDVDLVNSELIQFEFDDFVPDYRLGVGNEEPRTDFISSLSEEILSFLDGDTPMNRAVPTASSSPPKIENVKEKEEKATIANLVKKLKYQAKHIKSITSSHENLKQQALKLNEDLMAKEKERMHYEKLHTNCLQELSKVKEQNKQLREEHGRMAPYSKILGEAVVVKDQEIQTLKNEKIQLQKQVASLMDFCNFSEAPPVKRRKRNAKSSDGDQSKSAKGNATKGKAQPKQENALIKLEKPDYAEVVVKQEQNEAMQDHLFQCERQLDMLRNLNTEKDLRILELTRNAKDLAEQIAEATAKEQLLKKEQKDEKKYVHEIAALKRANQEKDLRIEELTRMSSEAGQNEQQMPFTQNAVSKIGEHINEVYKNFNTVEKLLEENKKLTSKAQEYQNRLLELQKKHNLVDEWKWKYTNEIAALKGVNQEKDLRIEELTNRIPQLQKEYDLIDEQKWQFLGQIQEELDKAEAESMSKSLEIEQLKRKIKELENESGCEKETVEGMFPAITELFTSHPHPEHPPGVVASFLTSLVNDIPSSLLKALEKSDTESNAGDSDEFLSCKFQALNEKDVDSVKSGSTYSPLGVSETQIDGQLESSDAHETSLQSMTFCEPISSQPEDSKEVEHASQVESFGARDTFLAVNVTEGETCTVSEIYKEEEKLSRFNNVGPNLTELDNSVSSPVQKSDISSYSHFEEVELGGQPVIETTMHESNSDIMPKDISDIVTVEDVSEVKKDDYGMFTKKLDFNGVVSQDLVFESIKNVCTKSDLNGEDCATKLSETLGSPALQDGHVKDGNNPVSLNVVKKLAPRVEHHLNIVSESADDCNELETEDCSVRRCVWGARIFKERKPKSKRIAKTAPWFKDSSILDTSELDDSKFTASDCWQKDNDFLSTKRLESITVSSIGAELEPQEHASDINDLDLNTSNIPCDVQNENVLDDSKPWNTIFLDSRSRMGSCPDKLFKESESLECMASECSQRDNLLPSERNKLIAVDTVKVELEPRKYTSDIQDVNKNKSNIPWNVKNENVSDGSQLANAIVLNSRPQMRSCPEKMIRESESLESMESECSQRDNLLPTERNNLITADSVDAELKPREYTSNIWAVNANIPCHIKSENILDSGQRLRSHCDKILKRPESKVGSVPKISPERKYSPCSLRQPNFSLDFQQRVLAKAAKSRKQKQAEKSKALHPKKSKRDNVPNNSSKRLLLIKLAKNKKQDKAKKLNTSQLVKQSKIPLLPQMPIKVNEGLSSVHPLKVALDQLDRLKFDNSARAYNQFKRCFINSLKNPAIVQTCDEIVQITCEHLISSTRDPFSSYIKTAYDVEVLLPRIERCMIDAFCDLGRTSKIQFKDILASFVVAIANRITEKDLPLYGVTALCRTYGGICRFREDIPMVAKLDMVWGLVYLLRCRLPSLFPFCASSILSVWPHAWSEKKQSGFGVPQKFILKSMLELPNCSKEMRNSWMICKKAIKNLYEQDIKDIEHVTLVDLIQEFQRSEEFFRAKETSMTVVEMFQYAADYYGISDISGMSEAEQPLSPDSLQNKHDVPKK